MTSDVVPPSDAEGLRGERDGLDVETARPHRPEGRRGWLRSASVGLLILLAVVTFTAAVAGGWARRNFLDTDRFVARTAPLVDDPAVQEALTLRLTAQLVDLIDPQELFAEALPERGQILAVPLASAVEGFVADQVASFVESDRFASLWEGAVRIAHDSSTTLLRGRSGDVFTIEEGQVTLNLVPVVDGILRRIGEASPEIFGREVEIPDLSVEELPPVAIARLEDALDVQLDDDFGQFVVYDDDTLAAAQDGVRLVDRAVYVLLPAAVLCAGAALWLSGRRRRTLLQLATGIALGMVLLRRVVFAAENEITALPPTATGERAAAVITDAFLDPLLTFAAWAVIAAAVIVVVAVLTSDYPWVVRLRRRTSALAQALVTVARDRSSDEASVAWVTSHRDALLVGGVVFGLLVLWTTDLSWLGLAVVLALIALFEAAVQRMSAGGVAQEHTPSG